ncbi:uncharacterized protein [Solanum tuberosum]|uniref:uncharacterized protein isoform X3 n=1 Tax=Solanum tuberosum TaxID=4113 RepID=UPI00073A41B8|nr:PREDICTED: uncharacterized protein LOC102596459 isoform X3 [Solanum tuberosum]
MKRKDSVELVMTNEPTSRRDKEFYNKMNKNNFSNIRCAHCTGPLSKEMETSEWTVPPLIRDSFSMIGSAVGGTTSAFYGFNHVMPIVRRWVKGRMWLHFLVGAPPVIVFSSACAGLAGGAVPAFAQLASSSYHAVISSSTLPPTASQDENMRKSRTSSTL